MKTHILRSKDLSKIGYTDNAERSLALNITNRYAKHQSKSEQLAQLAAIKENPTDYVHHEIWGVLAKKMLPGFDEKPFSTFELETEPKPFQVYGKKDIEASAVRQMETAMRLPVAVKGALMPDAHTGYGLPIGGVLATENAVIPYAVGVDIGCRMALGIFDYPERLMHKNAYAFKTALKEFTHFGMEGGLDLKQEHEILDRPEFKQTEFLKRLHGKAVRQLGSSGSGNHFVEFGLVTLYENNALHIPEGTYVALLSHSGSRGLGANIAQFYTQRAMETCRLPKQVQHLAWLDLETETGQEYWQGMTLAGDYAKACHDQIHHHLGKALGLKPLAKVENHHNFAWQETFPDGRTHVVHRKGATPAHENELGIIPGSMTGAGYLVSGQGSAEALFSASHGAGRAMSRKKAKESMTASALKKMLGDAGVTLIGGSVEENPNAYKNIEQVMQAQSRLIKIEGKFTPKIVRMNKD